MNWQNGTNNEYLRYYPNIAVPQRRFPSYITSSFTEVEYETVNCKNTFEGIYNFTYEMQEGGGGICAHPNSIIVACQEPGK